MAALKLKKALLVGLASWLSEQSLLGQESRQRTKFVDILSDGIREFETDRVAIVKKYAVQDEDGNPKINPETNSYEIQPDKLQEFSTEYTELANEDWILDILEGNKFKFLTVRDILLNTDYKFGPREGDDEKERAAKFRQSVDYTLWCDAFEAVEL